MLSGRGPVAALASAAALSALLATPAAGDVLFPEMAPAMAPVMGPMMASGPLGFMPGGPSPMGCFGNSIIGITLEGSSTVCPDFSTAVSEITEFIDATSDVDSSNGANGNLYFVNSFSTFVSSMAGEDFAGNADRAVSDEVDITFTCGDGSVNAAGGIGSLTSAFDTLGAGRGIAFVILASDPDPGNPFIEAIAALRARGVVVVAIAVGDGTSLPVLLDIADEDAAGADLIFTAPSFDDLSSTLVAAFTSVDVDNDGLSDCEDGCPTDELKVAPGTCGCGVIDGFAGTCINFDDFLP